MSVIIDTDLQQTISDEYTAEHNLHWYGTDGFTTETATCLVELCCDLPPLEFDTDPDQPIDPQYTYCTYTDPSHPHLQPMLVSAASTPEESLALARVTSLYLMHIDFDQSIEIDIMTKSVYIRDRIGREITHKCDTYQRMHSIILSYLENK